ncbi:MAG: ABC transporter permease [Bacteroidales bacterium]|nr:ABC transporter permease [Bacteroidota bacterium]MBL6949704.1 ABC transporter permease [Bacteroidales bacterium]
MIWIIAWKNIWRNKVRSLVVILAITFGLFGGVFSSAIMKGMVEQRIKEAVSRETGHIQIHDPKYIDDNEIQYVIDGEAGQLEDELDSLPQVKAWSSRIKFQAMANSANAGTGVMIFGIDPEKEQQVTEISTMICDSCGTYLDGNKKNQIVVGKALAKKLKVRLRSKIVLTFQDKEGNLTGAAFRICGIYRTSNSMFDEMNVFVRKVDIAKLLITNPQKYQELVISLISPVLVTAVQDELTGSFPELLVRNWKEIDPMLGMMSDLTVVWLYMFMTIILLALGFGIINTMLMTILERTRELGMLAAIGMNKRRIFLMIMLESVYLSLTGAAIGMALGYILTLYTSHTGINLSSFAEGFEKIGYNPIMYPYLDLNFFIILTVMVICIGILASIYPARKALKLNPAEAVRTE